jgi:hypothetical protein
MSRFSSALTRRSIAFTYFGSRSRQSSQAAMHSSFLDRPRRHAALLACIAASLGASSARSGACSTASSYSASASSRRPATKWEFPSAFRAAAASASRPAASSDSLVAGSAVASSPSEAVAGSGSPAPEIAAALPGSSADSIPLAFCSGLAVAAASDSSDEAILLSEPPESQAAVGEPASLSVWSVPGSVSASRSRCDVSVGGSSPGCSVPLGKVGGMASTADSAACRTVALSIAAEDVVVYNQID